MLAPLPDGGQVLLVTAAVEDPRYLQQRFIVSSQFKKESDGSKWDPTPMLREVVTRTTLILLSVLSVFFVLSTRAAFARRNLRDRGPPRTMRILQETGSGRLYGHSTERRGAHQGFELLRVTVGEG